MSSYSKGYFESNGKVNTKTGEWNYSCAHVSESNMLTTASFTYKRKLEPLEIAGKFKTVVANGGRDVFKVQLVTAAEQLDNALIRIRPDLEHDSDFMHMSDSEKREMYHEFTGESIGHVRRNNPYT